MSTVYSVTLSRVVLVSTAMMLGSLIPASLWAQGTLENPQPRSSKGGIGVVSGWVCNAIRVDIIFDGVATLQAAYGTSREDTRSVCGDANNGFGLLLNWNLLRDGTHSVRALADGVEFGRATFTVVTLGTEFLRGANGCYLLENFPQPGKSVTVCWEQSSQSFVITGAGTLAQLQKKLSTLAWLAYAPTSFDPRLGCPNGFPTEATIRADLQLARSRGFTGLITFAADCTLREIPRIAREVGFSGVIMGLFLFNATTRQEEVANAKAAAQYVDGYGIGNEGLIGCGGTLYTGQTLIATMAEIRNATGKPVTTTEQIEDYLNGGCLNGFLLNNGEWMFPITHAFNNGIRDPQAGVTFTEDRFRQLSGLTTKTVFFKEVGWPTGGNSAATEQQQETFFLLLRNGPVQYAYFEGFDQPFKVTFPAPWEQFFGLFRQNRTQKLFISRNQP